MFPDSDYKDITFVEAEDILSRTLFRDKNDFFLFVNKVFCYFIKSFAKLEFFFEKLVLVSASVLKILYKTSVYF